MLCRRLPVLLALLVPSLVPSLGCADLTAIEPGCGNNALEPGEDCDGVAVGFACRGPEEPNACRWDCSATPCPSGYACGADDVCRAPSGAIALTSSIEAAAVTIEAADMDGDERDELLQAGLIDLNLHYFDDEGLPETRTVLPDVATQFGVGDFDGDGLFDVAAITEAGGITLSPGRPGRQFGTHPFTSFVLYPLPRGGEVFFPARVDIPFVADLIVSLSSEGVRVLVQELTGVFPATVSPPLPEITELAGFDHADVDPEIGCGDLALALVGAASVEVHTLCVNLELNLVGASGHVPPRTITLPDGVVVANYTPVATATAAPVFPRSDTGIRFFHAPDSPDTLLDIAVATSDGWYVSYGVGDGRFHSTPEGPGGLEPDERFVPLVVPALDCRGNLVQADEATERGPTFPLDAADLNADGLADFIVADGIYVSLHSYGIDRWQKLCSPIDGVVLGDFNGDEQKDVALYQRGLPAVSLSLAHDGALLTHVVPLPAGIVDLRVGDVDGDTLDDMVAHLNDQSGDRVMVAYGRVGGGPESFVEVARLDNVISVAVGRTVGDSIGDIVVLTETDAAREAAVLIGNRNRALRSPLVLFPSADAIDYPTALAFADSDDGGSEQPLTASAVRVETGGYGELAAWQVDILADQTASIVVDPAQLSVVVPEDHRIVPLDADADGLRDEAVVLGSGRVVFVADGAVVAAGPFPSELDDVESTLGVTPKALVTDADGDGFADVLVTGKGRLGVIWNDDGRLAVDDIVVLDMASVGGFVTCVAALATDDDPAAEVVVGLFPGDVIQLDLSARDFAVVGPPLGFAGDPTTRVVDLAAGDFDGDGVDDLAVAYPAVMEIHRGVPRP